jgi:hypothetical protein
MSSSCSVHPVLTEFRMYVLLLSFGVSIDECQRLANLIACECDALEQDISFTKLSSCHRIMKSIERMLDDYKVFPEDYFEEETELSERNASSKGVRGCEESASREEHVGVLTLCRFVLLLGDRKEPRSFLATYHHSLNVDARKFKRISPYKMVERVLLEGQIGNNNIALHELSEGLLLQGREEVCICIRRRPQTQTRTDQASIESAELRVTEKLKNKVSSFFDFTYNEQSADWLPTHEGDRKFDEIVGLLSDQLDIPQRSYTITVPKPAKLPPPGFF